MAGAPTAVPARLKLWFEMAREYAHSLSLLISLCPLCVCLGVCLFVLCFFRVADQVVCCLSVFLLRVRQAELCCAIRLTQVFFCSSFGVFSFVGLSVSRLVCVVLGVAQRWQRFFP